MGKTNNKTKQNQQLQYLHMDVTDMRFDSNSFGVVIDKATFDAMYCSRGNDSNRDENILKMSQEILRILKPGGSWVIISRGEVTAEKNALLMGEGNAFQFSVRMLQDETVIYLLQKKII